MIVAGIRDINHNSPTEFSGFPIRRPSPIGRSGIPHQGESMRLLVLAISRFVGWITDQTVFLRLLLVLLLPSSLFGDLPVAGWREFRGGPIMGNLGRTVLPATWNE